MKNVDVTTHLSTFDETGAVIRGKSLVDDLIGEVTFTEMIYFYVLGRVPSAAETRVLDAVLVTLVDHGIVGALSARMVYRSSPDSIQGAMAAGLLGVGSQFGGVMEQTGRLLEEMIASEDAEAKAVEIVRRHRQARRPMPGFGHKDFRPDDPRTPKLLAIAEKEGVSGKYVAALQVLAHAVDSEYGKHLTINATAGMAALLGDIGVPFGIMRGFAAISRAPGLLGHIYEEQQAPVGGRIALLVQDAVPYAGDMPHRD